MAAARARLRDAVLGRYLVASIAALAVDTACFFTLLAAGLPAGVAAALGYVAGIGVHWLLSSRAVFTDAPVQSGRARARQKGLFVASALVGLGLTWVIVALGTQAGTAPALAKGAAVAVSFVAVWWLRRRLVFAAG